MKNWKAFSAWRLTNLNSATNIELELAASSCETLALISGVLVVVGLVGEVIEAVFHLHRYPFFERWGSVVADVPVAVGVFGEIFFSAKGAARQSELQRRSNIRLSEATEKAAAANQKAEEAQLARAKLETQLAPRLLTKEQYEIFQTLKGQIAAVNITPISDYEASRFAAQIAQALGDAGIEVKLFPPRVGPVWTDVYLVIPDANEDFRKEPLYGVFKSAGISVGGCNRSQRPMYDFPPDIPIIMVGEKKGLSYPEIPYAFNFSTKNVTRVE